MRRGEHFSPFPFSFFLLLWFLGPCLKLYKQSMEGARGSVDFSLDFTWGKSFLGTIP